MQPINLFGGNREMTMAQIMNSLLPNSDWNWKKVGKSTRPFRYDLNQIPYDYTVEGTNRFKGLGLNRQSTWRMMDGGLCHCTRGRDEDHIQEKEMQKGQMVVWEGLTNSCENKRSERQRRNEKIYPFECRVPKNSKGR